MILVMKNTFHIKNLQLKNSEKLLDADYLFLDKLIGRDHGFTKKR